jgi:hypothetical protein
MNLKVDDVTNCQLMTSLKAGRGVTKSYFYQFCGIVCVAKNSLMPFQVSRDLIFLEAVIMQCYLCNI